MTSMISSAHSRLLSVFAAATYGLVMMVLHANVAGAIEVASGKSVRLPAVGPWNGYLNQINILECVNLAPLPAALQLEIKDLNNRTLGARVIDLPSHGTVHTVLNEFPIAEAYGTFVLSSFDGGSQQTQVQCQVVFYRQNPEGQSKLLQYAFSILLADPLHGRTSGVFNSMNPRGAGAGAVVNFLTIYNPGTAAFTADIEIHRPDGTLDQGKSFKLNGLRPGARIDIPLGHPDGQTVGVYQIVPHLGGQPYGAFLARYCLDEASVQFGFALAAQQGVSDSGIIPATTMGHARNWAEIANVSPAPATVLFEAFDSAGRTVSSETLALAPFAQHHLFLNALIGSAAVGSFRVRLSGDLGAHNALLVQSAVYGNSETTGDVEWAYAAQANEGFRTLKHEFGLPVNTFLQAPNWLRLYSPPSELGISAAQHITIDVFDQSGIPLSTGLHDLTLEGQVNVPLHEIVGPDFVGTVRARTADANGLLTGDMLRVYPNLSVGGEPVWDPAGSLGLVSTFSPYAERRPWIFDHIKNFAVLFVSPNESQAKWVADRIDSSVTKKAYTGNTFSYINLSDLVLDSPSFMALVRNSIAAGRSPEELFFHYSTTHTGPFPYTENKDDFSIKEDRFLKVLRRSIGTFQDITAAAFGDLASLVAPATVDVPTCSAAGDGLYIGDIAIFDELHLYVQAPPENGAVLTMEYSTPSGWRPVSYVSDSTEGFTKPGTILIQPQSDWAPQPLTIGVSEFPLRWVRIQCLANKAGPLLRSSVEKMGQYSWLGVSAVSGAPYSKVDGQPIIPGWRFDLDLNHDGYLDNGELAVVPPGTDIPTRTIKLSRAPAPYMTNRFAMNVENPIYSAFARTLGVLARNTGASGIFIDNSGCSFRDVTQSTSGIWEYGSENPSAQYISGYGALLRDIGTNIGPVFLNGGCLEVLEAAGEQAVGLLREGQFNHLYSATEYPWTMSYRAGEIQRFCAAGKQIALHGNPDPAIAGNSAYPLSRHQLFSLARYYLTAEQCSLFMFADSAGNDLLRVYAPWLTWFPAIEFDIGRPHGSYYEITTGQLIENPGFDAGFADWSCGSVSGPPVSCSAQIDNGTGSPPNSVLKLSASASNTYTYSGGSQVVGGLQPNTTYILSGRVRAQNITSTNNQAIAARLEVLVNGTRISVTGLYPGTHDWTTMRTPFRTGTTVTSALLRVSLVGTGGTALFDDITIAPPPVYGRQYDNGLVLVRPAVGFAAGDESSRISVPLPAGYCPLSPSGALGEKISSTSLLPYEGQILVSEGKPGCP